MVSLTILKKSDKTTFEVEFDNNYLMVEWLKKHRLPTDWRRHKNYNRYLEVIGEWRY